MKYRLKTVSGEPVDKTIEDTWQRVAKALAQPEKEPDRWASRFYEVMADFRFLPAGRIVAGAGAKRDVTLFNCFVMGTIPDDMGGIFENLKEAALTMQQGGGVGYDFSTLRPKGSPVHGVGADASGPLSFMDVWDAMCRTIMSAGSRRGAMMATIRCDHPDVEAFIEAKQEAGRLRMFNLSVLVTDALMKAVKEDEPWELVFDGVCYKSLQARELWDKIMRATYACAEPGVIFIDQINQRNNLYYCEEIRATNPCGEQPLPPYGACLLGSVNLARLVRNPFSNEARIEHGELSKIVSVAVRMLDNVIDVSEFPLPQQQHEAQTKRRIGLGVTGLADALILCEARYGGKRAIELTKEWMHTIQRAAYLTSIQLSEEKGSFTLFNAQAYLASQTIQELDTDIQQAICKKGIRNSLLTSIAPTGTVSLLADNTSSGLEPVFSYTYKRNIQMPDGSRREERVSDYAYRLYRRMKGEKTPLPDYFIDSQHLTPREHLRMQLTVQAYVDSSISKTINCPEGLSFEDFKDVYLDAYKMGCKGCTTYRPNAITGAVLVAEEEAPHEKQEELLLDYQSVGPQPEDALEAGGVIYMTQPLDRPGELPGQTYKVKWPESNHAMYITINDVVQDGRRRPFEIFINSKNMEHYSWTVALTRMISAVFRRGGDVSFVVDELKAVFDPRGGQWMKGRYVPSLLAAIGEVIERHMVEIGFLVRSKTGKKMPTKAEKQVVGMPSQRLPQCPKCGEASIIYQEGCDLCISCDYSRCA